MVVTTFLSVLILALFLGNVFLSLASPKRLRKQFQAGLEGLPPEQLEARLVQEPSRAVVAAGPKQVSFEQRLGLEKFAHLNKRMDRLEQILLKLGSSKVLAKKLDATTLSRKMDDYGKFKETTRLEIAALKQRLDKVQPAPKKSKKNIGISDEKLRDLVFRASN
jgi:hypothetical protein